MSELEDRLVAILEDAPGLMRVMAVARELGLPDWMIFSGAVYPISSMPLPARVIASLFPGRFFVTALRALMLKGSSAFSLAPELLALIAFCLAALGFGAFLLNRERRAGA